MIEKSLPSESYEMEESGPVNVRRWEDLDTDILVKIFGTFDIIELTSGIGHVCHNWRMAACDPLLWKTLDLSNIRSNFIKIPLEPYVYVDGRSDKLLNRILKIALNLSSGHIRTLIFHYNLYITDELLTYTAARCPNLRRLVLPSWNRVKRTGICQAISCWPHLESLTMPSIPNPQHVMYDILLNCRKFSELKVMGPCDRLFANALVRFQFGLKVLSFRCSVIVKEALIILLDQMPHLESLNISHCLILDIPPPPAPRKLLTSLDDSILQKGSRLRQFVTCMSASCIMCERTRADEGLLRWYRYDENLWKADELKSLAL